MNRRFNKAGRTVRSGYVILSRSRAVLVVDSTKVKSKALKDYESSKRQLEKLRLQIENFHEKDEPAFRKWTHLTLGPLITELNQLNSSYSSAIAFLHRVDFVARHFEVPHHEAIQRLDELEKILDKQLAEEEEEEMKSSGHAAGEAGSAGPGGDEDLDDDFDSEMDRFFESLLSGQIPPRAMGEEAEKRLKEIYRKLARLLHPDSTGKVSEQMRSWWNEAQDAYEQRDLARLEALLSAVEGGSEKSNASDSVSMLRELTREVKRSLSRLRRELREFKDSPAWGCATQSPPVYRERILRSQLQEEIRFVRNQLASAKATEADWRKVPLKKTPPQGPHSSSRRRRQQSNDGFGQPDLPDFPF